MSFARFGRLSSTLCVLVLLCSFVGFTSSTISETENDYNYHFINNDEQFPDFQGLLPESNDLHDARSSLFSRLLMPQYLRQFAGGILKDKDSFLNHTEELFNGVDNDACKDHVIEFLTRIDNVTKLLTEDVEENTWALHMLDAWAKVPDGILSGHVNAMGDFDECIEMKARDISPKSENFSRQTPRNFEGRYCTVIVADYGSAMNNTRVPIPEEPPERRKSLGMRMGGDGIGGSSEVGLMEAVSLGELIAMITEREGVLIIPSVGVCFPNSCSRNDIQQVLVNALDMVYNADYSREDFLPTRPPKLYQSQDENEDSDNSSYPTGLPWPLTIACYEEKKPDFDAADISVITILAAFLGFCLITGVFDYWQRITGKPINRRSTITKYVMAFSLYTNLKSWRSTARPPGDFGCLHGLRFFSTSWIILAHTYYAINFLPLWNMVAVKSVHGDPSVLTVLNSSLSVDTFFVIAGMLICFNTMKTLDRFKGRLNIPKLWFKRYFRLTPPYAILVGVMATIIPYLGNGPYWVVMNTWAKNCEDNWWTNLLYVNNLVNTSFICQGETWYLANDMQFTLLSPFIVYPMWKLEVVGVGLLFIYTVMSCIAPMLVVHFLEVSPTVIPTRDFQDWNSFRQLYIRPYTRIATYLVGIFLGWLLYKAKGKKIKLHPLFVIAMWTMSTAVAPAVVYGIYPWFDPETEIKKAESMAYAGLGRFAFGVAVAWIIFACVKGYGGIVNTFLSWKVFMPLARLCYCVYLVSLHLQMILHVNFKQPTQLDIFIQLNYFLSHMIMSFAVALIFWLLFEQPFLVLLKLIFDEGTSGPNPNKKGQRGLKATLSERYVQPPFDSRKGSVFP